MACYMLMLGSALAYYHYAKHRPNMQSIPSIIVERYLARFYTISNFCHLYKRARRSKSSQLDKDGYIHHMSKEPSRIDLAPPRLDAS